MAAATLTIGGTPRPMRAGSLVIVEQINGRSTLSADVVSLDGSYSPDTDDDVVLEDDAANVLFAGLVREPDENWQVQGDTLFTTVRCDDYTSLAERRFISATTTGGISGRDAIDYVVDNYLDVYGVTRDAGMGTGATLGALSYDYASAMQVINDIVKLAAPDGWVWRIDENKVLTAWAPGVGVPCPWSMTTGSSKLAGGDIKITRSREYYANRVVLVYGDGTSTPAIVDADDAGEQATYGIYETVIRAAGPFDVTTAQTVCDAYLTRLLVRPRQIVFATMEPGARAGQTLSVNLAARNLVGDFLITQVVTRDIGGEYLRFEITAVEGGVFPATWKDAERQATGGSSGLVTAGGSVIISQIGRSSYWLGGSMFAGDQSSGPSVLDAVDYVDVMIDSAAIAGASVTAVVMAKAGSAGVTVTPQVYNVTTASVAGTGSAVTGTTITTVTFAITVTAGQNLYRLRMTPDTADVYVFCQGYLEVGR